MADSHPIQTNFTGGEVSPLLIGRVDLSRYQNSARSLSNFIIRPQGGITRRSGFEHLAKTKHPTRVSRIDKFIFSDEQAYALEWGHKYVRFYVDGKILLSTDAADESTNPTISNDNGRFKINFLAPTGPAISGVANNGSGLYRITTATAHRYKTGNKVQISATGTTADATWTITWISNTQFDLQGSTFGSTASSGTVRSMGVNAGDLVTLSDGVGTLATTLNRDWVVHSVTDHDEIILANSTYVAGTWNSGVAYSLPVEVSTTYDEADVETLYFAQSADFLYIAHRLYPPRRLIRSSAESWSIQDVEFTDGPYLPVNSFTPNLNQANPDEGHKVLDMTMTLSSYSHTATVKASSNFVVGDINKYLEYKEGDQWRLAKLTAIDGSDASKGTVQIIDEVLIHLDEQTKLTTRYRSSGLMDTPGLVGARRKMDSGNYHNSTGGTGAGTVIANFSGTFAQQDVNKYLRTPDTASPPTAYYWKKIVSVPENVSGLRATVAAALTMVSIHGSATMSVYDEVRTATLTTNRAGAAAAVFSSAEVGRHIRLSFGGRWVWCKVTAYGATNSLTVALYSDPPRDPADAANLAGNGVTGTWRLGAWMPPGTTSGVQYPGYPAVVCFHEQRLWFGRTDAEAQTLWASESGSFESMSPSEPDSTVLDTSALTFTLVSNQVEPIKWMSSGAVLLVGTSTGEWQGRAASTTMEPITPTNVSFTPQTSYGGRGEARPYRSGPATLFIDKGGRKVREMIYDFNIDAFNARDLTVAAEHILKQGGKAKMCGYQQDPINLFWVVLNDGTAAVLTYERDQEIYGWSRVSHGTGDILSLTVLPSDEDGDSDDVYVIVLRTVSGTDERYVERLRRLFDVELGDALADAFFVDGGVDYTLTAAKTTIDGLYHLEGSTVNVVADGVSVGTKVVSSGSITLTSAATTVVAGVAASCSFATLPLEGGAVLGTSQVKNKRTNHIGLRLKSSLAIDLSADGITYYSRTLDSGGLYTGDWREALNQGYRLDPVLYGRCTGVGPLTVLMVAPEMKTYEQS